MKFMKKSNRLDSKLIHNIIKEWYTSSSSIREICEEYNVNMSTIKGHIYGPKYRHYREKYTSRQNELKGGADTSITNGNVIKVDMSNIKPKRGEQFIVNKTTKDNKIISSSDPTIQLNIQPKYKEMQLSDIEPYVNPVK